MLMFLYLPTLLHTLRCCLKIEARDDVDVEDTNQNMKSRDGGMKRGGQQEKGDAAMDQTSHEAGTWKIDKQQKGMVVKQIMHRRVFGLPLMRTAMSL